MKVWFFWVLLWIWIFFLLDFWWFCIYYDSVWIFGGIYKRCLGKRYFEGEVLNINVEIEFIWLMIMLINDVEFYLLIECFWNLGLKVFYCV